MEQAGRAWFEVEKPRRSLARNGGAGTEKRPYLMKEVNPPQGACQEDSWNSRSSQAGQIVFKRAVVLRAWTVRIECQISAHKLLRLANHSLRA
jgi:hypothetical protein